MNYYRTLLITGIIFICFSNVQSRYLKDGSSTTTSPSEIRKGDTLKNSLKKRPKFPKPCKKCGGGEDDDDDDDDEFYNDNNDDNNSDNNGNSTNSSEEEDECFPADAIVKLNTNERIRMDELEAGHLVMNYNERSSPVFGFTHRDDKIKTKFVRIVTRNGNLTVTGGHYIYVVQKEAESFSNHQLRLAREVKQGDFLVTDENKGLSKVQDIQLVTSIGLYNPHTLSGELMVNGFRVSTFTKAVDPATASSFLAPLKALFLISRLDIISSTFSHGCPQYLDFICRNVKLFSA